jgi:hypothetical protein
LKGRENLEKEAEVTVYTVTDIKEMDAIIWTGYRLPGTSVGFCEHDNEPSGSIKFGEFLD